MRDRGPYCDFRDRNKNRFICDGMAIPTRKRYSVIVIEENSKIVGWASINPYSHRCAYRGVGSYLYT